MFKLETVKDNGIDRIKMIPPEIIERLKREREERDRLVLQIPLYPPENAYIDRRIEDEETTEFSRIIVIEL